MVEPRDDADAVMLHGYDAYTTNLLLADFAAPNARIADRWEGRPLHRDHGGAARLVVPHLYFRKGAKWISHIEVIGRDRPGFWEVNGYSLRGDPWAEERCSR